MSTEKVNLERKVVGRHKIKPGSRVYLTRETEGFEPAVVGERKIGEGQEISWPGLTLTWDNGMPLYVEVVK
jgi:hypothetical protein